MKKGKLDELFKYGRQEVTALAENFSQMQQMTKVSPPGQSERLSFFLDGLLTACGSLCLGQGSEGSNTPKAKQAAMRTVRTPQHLAARSLNVLSL